MKKVSLFVVLFLMVATLGFSQVIANPNQVTFTASTDHPLVTKYSVGFFASGAVDPVQENDLGLGTPDSNNLLAFPINVHPIPFGLNYSAKVRAWVGDLFGPWSDPSNPFDRRPGKTGVPTVKAGGNGS